MYTHKTTSGIQFIDTLLTTPNNPQDVVTVKHIYGSIMMDEDPADQEYIVVIGEFNNSNPTNTADIHSLVNNAIWSWAQSYRLLSSVGFADVTVPVDVKFDIEIEDDLQVIMSNDLNTAYKFALTVISDYTYNWRRWRDDPTEHQTGELWEEMPW